MKPKMMSMQTLPIWSLALVAVAVAVKARGAELPPDDAVKPIEVARTGDYSEGVVVDHEGNLYFSHGKIVTKVSLDGKASTWAETGSPNGHKVLADGTHLICDASRHAVLHLDAEGKELAPASTTSDGQPIRGPNDLTLDPDQGSVWHVWGDINAYFSPEDCSELKE